MKILNYISKGILLFLLLCTLSGCHSAPEKETSTVEESTLQYEESAESISEEAIPAWQSELPEGMLIPDESAAEIPELTHFDNHYYDHQCCEYNEKQLEFIEETWQKENIGIKSYDSENMLECFLHLINKSGTHQRTEIYELERIPDTNFYLGDMVRGDEKDYRKEVVIGKILIAFGEEDLQISVFYDEDKLNENDRNYKLENGIHYYKRYPSHEDICSLEELGEKVNAEDYSAYSGRWFRYSPYNVPERVYKECFVQLDIDEDGNITGFLHQAFGDSFYGAAELTGTINGQVGEVTYAEDGFGHSGSITISFYENGLDLYVNEQGEPSFLNGFSTGHNTFLKE